MAEQYKDKDMDMHLTIQLMPVFVPSPPFRKPVNFAILSFQRSRMIGVEWIVMLITMQRRCH